MDRVFKWLILGAYVDRGGGRGGRQRATHPNKTRSFGFGGEEHLAG